ncbi:putative integral membrane protein [Brugia pahangi]
MDRSILQIGRLHVILNYEQQQSMRQSLLLSSLLSLLSSLSQLSLSTIISINKNKDNNKIVIVLFLLIIQTTFVESLVCYDGADCLKAHTCNECNGIGCIRMKSYNTEHIHTIALTCLPYATRVYQLEPAGCRISLSGDSEHCICYDNDYCNRASGLSLFNFKLVPSFILIIYVTISFTLLYLL